MKILILYYIPKNSAKYNYWYDGFTTAIDMFKNDSIFDITMINFYDNNNIDLNKYNIILIKWGFGSIMQRYCIEYFKNNDRQCLIGIFVSSIKIPSDEELYFYDIIFYETEWYNNYAKLNRHNNIYHAFGIDTSIMKNLFLEKEYDYIFVGSIVDHKRPLKLLNKTGKILVVGDVHDENITNKLKKNNIEIRQFVKYDELAKLYNLSNICYIPSTISGGGERAILEARSCGLDIEIENDNDKLLELTKCNIYDTAYYYKQIKRGIINTINKKILNDIDLYNTFNLSNVTIVKVGAMDGKSFDNSYHFILNNPNIKAYLIEPVRYYVDKLILNFKDAVGHIIIINTAIYHTNGKIDFNVIDPQMIVNNNLPSFLMGISSLYNDRNALSKKYWVNRGKILTEKYNWTFETIIEKYKKTIQVKTMTVESIVYKYNIKNIDILITSSSGHDYHVIKDFLKYDKPLYIIFEYSNLSTDLDLCIDMLLSYNYQLNYFSNSKCLAYLTL